MIMRLVKLPLSAARWASLLVIAGAIAYQGLAHSGRLASLPDHKNVLVGGRVVTLRPLPGPDGGRSVFVLEDLGGFVEVIGAIPEIRPAVGSYVLLGGTKWEIDGLPVVLADRQIMRL